MSANGEKMPGQPKGGAVGWKTVSVFVSSTFDDMHAERDYLVKDVFPRLREWCEQRRLRLVDVDLRWGVTEADATNNKRAVDVCLRRIDDCRPFFICLLGQRYGWIPRRQDVAAETSDAYPHIAGALGAASVTEMEIQHSTVAGKHVTDAFFYLRDPSYLADLPADPAQLRQRIYTDEAEEDAALRQEKLRVLREQKIPATGRPVRQYSARWNPKLRTPEIALPPQCPATLPENIETWRKNWQRWADVRVAGTDVNENAAESAKAAAHNQKLTCGRLADFAVGESSLGDVIFEDLKKAIEEGFSDHVEAGEQTDLQRESDLQEELIGAATEGFIGRAGDLAALDAYVDSDDARLFAVAAAGGIGKTTLLAKWIAKRREKNEVVFCRFIGVADRSSSVDSLLTSLADELRAAGRIEGEVPTDPRKLREKLPELLAECSTHGRTIIVIDALNQLDSGLGDLDWLPKAMPPEQKIVVSFKTGTPAADGLLARWRVGNVHVHECQGFENIEDRKKLVTGYLERHLKELDQRLLETLVTVPGAENPLYLRVVLGELRVFGAFGQLREKLAHDFGTSPIEAFAGVLRRLERDPALAAVLPSTSVPLIFGFLAHAHGGLPESAIVDLVETEVNLGSDRRRDVAASVALVLRQLRPYLAHREGSIDFFFESFNLAAKQRYTCPDAKLPMRRETAWSDALANWCAKWGQLEGPSQRYALRWLPRHLMDASRADDASDVMTEFSYHHARLERLGAKNVIDVTNDFAVVKAELQAGRRHRMETWGRFYDENAHFLRRPGIRSEIELLQRAAAHADESPITQSAEAWLDTNGAQHWWFRELGRPTKAASNSCLRVLEGHTHGVASVALHADGRRVVSGGSKGLGSSDNTVRVWNLETGGCLKTLEGHTQAVRSVVMHADGRRAVTGSLDNTVRVWDLETGACLKTLGGHTDHVSAVALSADGRQVVSVGGQHSRQDGRRVVSPGAQDYALRVWDLETGACVQNVVGHATGILTVALHSDGRRAVTSAENHPGSADHTVRVWDLETGACLRVLEGHTSTTNSIVIHPDGRRVVTGSQDRTIRVWDLETGECLRRIEGLTDGVWSLVLHAEGRRLISGGRDIRVWDLDTGACLRTLKGHTGTITSLALRADGRRVISGSNDKTIRVWDLDTDDCPVTQKGHTREVRSLVFHPDGRRVVSWSYDNTLRVWDAEGVASLKTLTGHTNNVYSVALHADGQRVVSGSEDKTVRVWSLETGGCLKTLTGHSGQVTGVALHVDGLRIVSAGGQFDQTMRVWHLDTGECLRTLVGHTSGINSVVLHPDGRRAISASWDKTVRVWDLDTGACLRTLVGHADTVWSVALHGDRRRGFSWSSDRTVRVWDLDAGTCLRTLAAHTKEVNGVELHADGRRLVSWGNDHTVRVWDLETGECLRTLTGHTDRVSSAALHADGRRIVTASGDHTVRVWDLETGECLGTWLGVSPFHVSLGKPSANGCSRVAAGCDDGSIHFFELVPPDPLTRTILATWSPTAPLVATALDTGDVTLHQWHAASAHLEELARSAPGSAPISSLRFSLDGMRLQVLAPDNTEHVLDATTLQPVSAEANSIWARMRALVSARPPTSRWSGPRDTSPDGAWRAVIRAGRLVVEAVSSPEIIREGEK